MEFKVLILHDTDDNHGVQYEFYLTEMRSDNTRTKSQEGEAAQFEILQCYCNKWYCFRLLCKFYNVIFRANIVLENLGVVEDAKLQLLLKQKLNLLELMLILI